jgi:hypothetical protein
MAGILYNHAPGKSQPTNVMIIETLFSHSQLLLLALTAEIQAVSFETSQLLLRSTRAIVDGSLFWEGESSPQFSSILVGPLGNLTVLESGFCSGNVTLPRIDCLDTESEVMGNFNSSLVTGSCSQVLFPTPLPVLASFSTR